MSRFARTFKTGHRVLAAERRSHRRTPTIWRVELGYYMRGVYGQQYASASIFEGRRQEIVGRIVRFFDVSVNPTLRNISAQIKDLEQCNYPPSSRRIGYRGVAKNGVDDATLSMCVAEHEGIVYRVDFEDDWCIESAADLVSGVLRPENESAEQLEERVDFPHLQTRRDFDSK